MSDPTTFSLARTFLVSVSLYLFILSSWPYSLWKVIVCCQSAVLSSSEHRHILWRIYPQEH